MEAVIVAVDAIVDVQAVAPDEVALNDANRVVGAVEEEKIANANILAAIEKEMIRAIVSATA
jgi:predicted RNA-binding protein associated with RNAse of E/G family